MSGYWIEPQIKFADTTLKTFNERMTRYAASLNKTLADTAYQWAGRLSEELMRETPPFVDKRASNKLDARMRGEEAVKEALLKSVTPASYVFSQPFTSKRLEQIVKRKQYDKWNDATQNMPKLKRWSAKPFTPDLHFTNRPKGRYDYMKEKLVLTFDERKWSKHLRAIQSRVGYLKAGWAVSALALKREVPSWIGRHLPYAKGKIEMNLEGEAPKIVMTNSTPTISRFTSRYNYAMDWIGKRMLKQMEMQLAAEARKAMKG